MTRAGCVEVAGAIGGVAGPDRGHALLVPPHLRLVVDGLTRVRVGQSAPNHHDGGWHLTGTLGFDIVTHYPGASFLGSGGYHHHLGANVWNSRGAGRRAFPSTGLADLEILADADALARIATRTGATRTGATRTGAGRAGAGRTLSDPWGTPVTLTPKEKPVAH